MPLGLVSDIHGNDRALAAVVAEFGRHGVEEVVCLGDAVQGGDEPREVAGDPRQRRRLSPRGACRLARTAHAATTKRDWTLARLDERHLDRIRGFPRTLRLGRLLAFHGSPRSYDDVLLPDSTDAAAWRAAGVDVLAGGHTHRQWTRILGGALYVNPGAVTAQPAEYAVVTGRSVEFLRCAY